MVVDSSGDEKKIDVSTKENKTLSDVDQKLKDDIELIFLRLKDADKNVSLSALNQLKDLIATSSVLMASVPKSLKFIHPFYEELKNLQSLALDKKVGQEIADIIASLSIVMGKSGDTLKFFTEGSKELTEIHSQEFVHHLVMDITQLVNDFTIDETLMSTINLIVQYQMSHNSEIDACDFLIEIGELEILRDFITHQSIDKVSEYLDRCANLMPDEEFFEVMMIIHNINFALECYPMALHAAIRLNSIDMIHAILKKCTDVPTICQLLFMLSGLQINIQFEEIFGNNGDELYQKIFFNYNKSTTFIESAKELDILSPKSLNDIFKKHVEFPKPSNVNDTNNGKNYLGISLTNNFVNCGFGSDDIFTTSDCMNWIDNLSTNVITSTVASTGYLYLWNLDQGLNFINQFLTSSDQNIKAGGIIAAGIIGTSIKDEFDSILSLVSEELLSSDETCLMSVFISLGIAYAGTNSSMVLDLILPHLVLPENESKSVDHVCLAALTAGMVSIGTANQDVVSSILRVLLQYPVKSLQSKHIDLLSLALGLLYAMQPAASKNLIESLQIIDDPLKSNIIQFVTIMAYAGSGNVEKILEMVRSCIDIEEDKDTLKSNNEDAKSNTENEDDKTDASNSNEKKNVFKNQSLAVIGMAIIAMGEKVGSEMMNRMISQMIRYGNSKVKSAIPLAIALLNVSKPSINVLQTLTKLTHDSDNLCSKNAMLGLGIASAGTNNAKYSQTIRQLKGTSAAQKDMSISFVLSIALGLCHLGKGAMSISPMRHDNMVIKLPTLGSLVTFSIFALHHNDFLLGKTNYLIHFLAPAFASKFLNTYNSNDYSKLSVNVRVGSPLDTLGQAGKHRKVTGFQTHNTPVAFACDEKAELATDDWIPISPYLEGNVILVENDSKMVIDD